MITIKTNQLNRILNSNKDFVFFNLDNNNKVVNFTLSNEYQKNKKIHSSFRIISTIKKEYEFITI